MRVLVTGGAGFIGSHVVDALLERKHEVCVLDDLSTGSRRNLRQELPFVEGDLRDAALLDRIFREFRPEAVCHQAAQTSVSVSVREPVRDADVNVIGSLRLLETCVAHDVRRVVFASTGGAIYGEVPEGAQADEGTEARPTSPYGCAKLAVERYMDAYRHEHDLAPTCLRYANVYGPRQDPHGEAGVVAIFCRRLLAGEPLQINARRDEGDAGCVRDYVFVDDVVRANVDALEGRIEAAVTNVGTGVGTSTLAVARQLAAAVGREPETRAAPRRPGDLERSVLTPGAAAPTPTPLAEGLAKTVAWFRSAG
ncbi:MAG: NAD-dependent epimerase/dehydratase family protein [Myxococcota bacterium]